MHRRAGGLSARDVRAARGFGHAGPQRPLSDLRAGESGHIVAIDPGADPATARRLFDLGFVPGHAVECVRRAPLGDPTVFRVADFEIALRRAQSQTIVVSV